MNNKKWKNTTLAGSRFGRLVVVKQTVKPDHKKVKYAEGRYWLCNCDCGKTIVIATGRLTSGNTRSCGCLAEEIFYPDITGKKFGLLTVIKDVGVRRSRSLWRCRCDCGREIDARGFYLNRGNIKSCGCTGHSSRALGGGQGLKNKAVRQYQDNAKTHNIEWSLSSEYAISLMESPCHYCDIPPSRIIRKPHCAGEFKCNGIDRKDNAIGYTRENSVPCCTPCNFKKKAMGYAEFAAWICRVYGHWASKFPVATDLVVGEQNEKLSNGSATPWRSLARSL